MDMQMPVMDGYAATTQAAATGTVDSDRGAHRQRHEGGRRSRCRRRRLLRVCRQARGYRRVDALPGRTAPRERVAGPAARETEVRPSAAPGRTGKRAARPPLPCLRRHPLRVPAAPPAAAGVQPADGRSRVPADRRGLHPAAPRAGGRDASRLGAKRSRGIGPSRALAQGSGRDRRDSTPSPSPAKKLELLAKQKQVDEIGAALGEVLDMIDSAAIPPAETDLSHAAS